MDTRLRSGPARYELVMFDFDGTLVDSERCITGALERALAHHGHACDVTGLKHHIGRTLSEAILATSPGLDAPAIAAVTASYREHYVRAEAELVVAYPDVSETLEALRAMGVRMAIATNKTTAATWPSLDRLGLRAFFEVIVGADQVARPKPERDIADRLLQLTGLTPDRALVVGDSVADVEMARRAGVAACAVTYGNQSAEHLATANPAFMIDTFRELIGLVDDPNSGRPKTCA